MKTYLFLLLYIFSGLRSMAHTANDEKQLRTGSMSIHCKNHHKAGNHADSVLVIFDRYDHSGAGIVRKVFYPDQQEYIFIPAIESGKYRVIIKFLGFHQEEFIKVVHIEKRKKKTVAVVLQNWGEFSKDAVIIPVESHNPHRLHITSM